MDKGKSINPIQLQISINVDSGADMICESSEEYSDEIGCRYYLWSGDFDDKWSIDEEITIVEDGTDLCNVDSDFCEVVVILTNTIDGEELQRFTVYVY